MTRSTAAQSTTPHPATTKVEIHLCGRNYVVACDAGEEKKLAEIVKLVDEKLHQIAGHGTQTTETRLFMLTCLMLADELIETRKNARDSRKAEEELVIAAVHHLNERVRSITEKIGRV